MIGEGGGVGGDDEELAAEEAGAIGKVKVGIAPEFPAGEVDADGGGIVEFDELAIGDGFAGWMIVDL